MKIIAHTHEPTLLSDIKQYASDCSGHVRTVATIPTLLTVLKKSNTVSLIVVEYPVHNSVVRDELIKLRHATNAPIILVGGRAEHNVAAKVINYGIDDYLPCPYTKRELFARLNALTRRLRAPLFDGSEIHAGHVHINMETQRVYVDGKEIFLSPIEYRILERLCRNHKFVVGKQSLEQSAMPSSGVSHLLNTHISNLRKKLGKGVHIVTVPRRGFVLETSS